jgi:hypothetical protein
MAEIDNRYAQAGSTARTDVQWAHYEGSAWRDTQRIKDGYYEVMGDATGPLQAVVPLGTSLSA